MSTESTARTPLPYRLVRPCVSTTVVLLLSMAPSLGIARRCVVSREIDSSGHPGGGGCAKPRASAGMRHWAAMRSGAASTRLCQALVTLGDQGLDLFVERLAARVQNADPQLLRVDRVRHYPVESGVVGLGDAA